MGGMLQNSFPALGRKCVQCVYSCEFACVISSSLLKTQQRHSSFMHPKDSRSRIHTHGYLQSMPDEHPFPPLPDPTYCCLEGELTWLATFLCNTCTLVWDCCGCTYCCHWESLLLSGKMLSMSTGGPIFVITSNLICSVADGIGILQGCYRAVRAWYVSNGYMLSSCCLIWKNPAQLCMHVLVKSTLMDMIRGKKTHSIKLVRMCRSDCMGHLHASESNMLPNCGHL